LSLLSIIWKYKQSHLQIPVILPLRFPGLRSHVGVASRCLQIFSCSRQGMDFLIWLLISQHFHWLVEFSHSSISGHLWASYICFAEDACSESCGYNGVTWYVNVQLKTFTLACSIVISFACWCMIQYQLLMKLSLLLRVHNMQRMFTCQFLVTC